jgi:hypothetical protein
MKGDARDVVKAGEGGGDENVELLYHPILRCYYDPTTNKYYEIA